MTNGTQRGSGQSRSRGAVEEAPQGAGDRSRSTLLGQTGRVPGAYLGVEDLPTMIAIRPTLAYARRWLPGRIVVLLPLVLALLAACSPGGKAPGY